MVNAELQMGFILAGAEGAFVSLFVDSGAWDQRC